MRPSAWLVTVLAVALTLLAGLPAAPAHAQQPPDNICLVTGTRWCLSHGRDFRLRPHGIWTPENPTGCWVHGISTLFPEVPHPPPALTLGQIYQLPAIILAQRGGNAAFAPTVLDVLTFLPDRFRVTLGLNAEGTATPPTRPPHPLVVAGAIVPSGLSYVVAELKDRRLPGVGVDWRDGLPVRGAGCGAFYAAVSVPPPPAQPVIRRGQELYTAEHFRDYGANSILYETPEIPPIVINALMTGGLSHVPAKEQFTSLLPPPLDPAVPLEPYDPPSAPRKWIAMAFGNPLTLDLTVTGRQRLGNGQTRFLLNASLPRSFEPFPIFRVYVNAKSGQQTFDTNRLAPLAPAPPAVNAVYRLFVDLPVAPARPQDFPEDTANVTVVASWWGFDVPPAPYTAATGIAFIPTRYAQWVPFLQRPPAQSFNFTLFRSGACTLGDTTSVSIKPPDRSIVIVLDASGSMGELIGSTRKIDQAKATAVSTLSALGPDTEVALIVYFDCTDVRLVPFTTDKNRLIAMVQRVQPRSSTPFRWATAYANWYAQNFASSNNRSVIVLSDGLETCGGRGPAAVQWLQLQ